MSEKHGNMLFLTCYFISLIFLYLSRLTLCPKIWSVLEKVPGIAEKKVYSAIIR